MKFFWGVTLFLCGIKHMRGCKKEKIIHIALQNMPNLTKIIIDQKSLVTINETSYKYKLILVRQV